MIEARQKTGKRTACIAFGGCTSCRAHSELSSHPKRDDEVRVARAVRYSGDTLQIANLRDPLALIACLTTGLTQATGVTSLTFTDVI